MTLIIIIIMSCYSMILDTCRDILIDEKNIVMHYAQLITRGNEALSCKTLGALPSYCKFYI